MTESKTVFTITPAFDRQFSNCSDPPSPRSGILKSQSSQNGKVSTNMNGNSSLDTGNILASENNGARKQVRHSIVSVDSTFDFSALNQKVSARRRCQRRLSVYLHTHVILIVVCSLAILDAVCVIGQLISDILIMKEKLNYFENIDEELTKELLQHMPQLNRTIHEEWNLHAILQVLLGNDIHGGDGPVPPPTPQSVSGHWNRTVGRSYELLSHATRDKMSHRWRRALEEKVPGHEVDHGILYELTHTFHLGSLAILSLLLLETLLKVFAMGEKLKNHKLEIFDAVVVTISWGLDVGLWEGIWAHPGTEAATFLIYLLPWRVVRIVNSFVLVIQEKEHVHLKIVKQRLRQSLKKSKEALEKASSYRHEVKALAGMCRKLGASESEITACSPSGKAGRRGSVLSVLERAASLTFISTMSSMGSLPSLFDMGGSSSSDEDERNEHNDLERAPSHNPTLRSAASSLTLDSTSGHAALGTEEHEGFENLAFETDDVSRRSKSSEKQEDEEKVVPDKIVIDRTDSNDYVPPEYDVVFTSKDRKYEGLLRAPRVNERQCILTESKKASAGILISSDSFT